MRVLQRPSCPTMLSARSVTSDTDRLSHQQSRNLEALPQHHVADRRLNCQASTKLQKSDGMTIYATKDLLHQQQEHYPHFRSLPKLQSLEGSFAFSGLCMDSHETSLKQAYSTMDRAGFPPKLVRFKYRHRPAGGRRKLVLLYLDFAACPADLKGE